MSPAIETRGITRVYRSPGKRPAIRAVDGVDLEVAEGEVTALLGPNGAGKTTMVRMLSCLVRPTEGTARVGGNDIREKPEKVRALCGISTEAPGLYERLTASEYLAFFAHLYGVSDKKVSARVEEQLLAAGLWDRRDDLLATFSKGMRQKMNIARAVVHRPRVVFLDEPTSGLDVEAAGAVRERILEMSQGTDTTFLICTHNLPEAERLCGHIAIMSQGRIVATGAPQELKRRFFGKRVFRVRLRQVLPQYRDAVASLSGVADVQVQDNGLVIHLDAGEEETNPQIIRRLVESGADIIAFVGEGRSLEEVYLHLMRQGAQEEEVTS